LAAVLIGRTIGLADEKAVEAADAAPNFVVDGAMAHAHPGGMVRRPELGTTVRRFTLAGGGTSRHGRSARSLLSVVQTYGAGGLV
jgi:hypothetical protein